MALVADCGVPRPQASPTQGAGAGVFFFFVCLFLSQPLCSANGGKWILEGTWGRPIRFGPLGLQRMNWLTGDGSIETRGPGDVLFDDSDYISSSSVRFRASFGVRENSS